MKRASKVRRGQPVIALASMIGLWTTFRVIAIALPVSAPQAPRPDWLAATGEGEMPVAAVVKDSSAKASAPRKAVPATAADATSPFARPLPSPSVSPLLERPLPQPVAPAFIEPAVPAPLPQPSPVSAAPRSNPMLAGGHQMLFLAALSQVPLPDVVMAAQRNPAQPVAKPASRWSGDGWLMLRRGGGVPALAAIGGSYGASRAGAVLRYRIDRTSPNRPSLYVRASAALDGSREKEAALGLSARPLSRLPLLAMAEGRVTRTPAGTRLRPAAALVTELPTAALPLGLRAEAYGQAGWVGGTGSTAFVDGQLRLEKPLIRLAGADFSAGGGLWGGAQKGASRLDAGPSARLTLHPTQASTLRVAADWRFRVAGKAAPQSGPAITLSAGF
ncbi:hypothetical protein OKA06_16585 [Novosphingobium sp. MW5]|nr:hypothetical protein [Novosphingobium sp. MW5]